MSLNDYVYRTKTFISGDWTGDQDLISKLKEWNYNNNLGLSFVDVHDLTQSSDDSLYCSIKASLRYNAWSTYCTSGKTFDNRSYIEYECEMALKDYNAGELKKIVVIYNGLINTDRSRCPEVLRYVGTHIGSDCWDSMGRRAWDYAAIKKAICG